VEADTEVELDLGVGSGVNQCQTISIQNQSDVGEATLTPCAISNVVTKYKPVDSNLSESQSQTGVDIN
jgi:hypothetical protein